MEQNVEKTQPKKPEDPFGGLSEGSDYKQIKKAGVRHGDAKIVTDDVNKLKSISIEPHLPDGDYINYYIEPVRIEYYIPKESRFAIETKYLYIPLIDPVPRPDPRDALLKEHIKNNEFFDLIEIMNEHPEYITDILDSYNSSMKLYESVSRAMLEVRDGNTDRYRSVFYLCELLIDYEPTLAALEHFGAFQSWNLNWLIRKINGLKLEFYAADKTVSYFIKLRNEHAEKNELDYDERFEILATLFFQQAFPNRGLENMKDDYFIDIFDR